MIGGINRGKNNSWLYPMAEQYMFYVLPMCEDMNKYDDDMGRKSTTQLTHNHNTHKNKIRRERNGRQEKEKNNQ